MKPFDLPPPEQHPHGTRARYVGARCRCDECRRANTAYGLEREHARRRGDTNALVPAAPVAEHIQALSTKGVGKRAIAAACDVPTSTLWKIVTGRRQVIREKTAAKILAVDAGAISDGTRVPAGPTWRMVRELLRAGLTKGEISRRLGNNGLSLQIQKRQVLASTELRVRRLHAAVLRELQEVEELERAAVDACADCGYSHDPATRQAAMRRALPCTVDELREAHPCWWDRARGEAKDRVLYRDLEAVGAERSAIGVWSGRAAA